MRDLAVALLAIVVAGTLVQAVGDDSGPGRPCIGPGEIRMQPTQLPKPKGMDVTLETYPRTSGSTSAEPMGVWVACRLLNKECMWPEKSWGERRLLPLDPGADTSVPLNRKHDARFYTKIRHHGTHGSYKMLIDGKTDLIYECRRPSEDEQSLMKEKDVELDIRPIALDAFVFLRHEDNSVKGLTMSDVRKIYTRGADGKGQITNWQEIGGPDDEIHPFVRNRNSGSQETMQSLVMKERLILEGRRMTGASMMGPYNMMHRDKLGIGFTFFYYQRHMAPFPIIRSKRVNKLATQQVKEKQPTPPVRMFAIDGVMPSRETIADRTYPLVTEVYVVTRKDLDPGHAAATLRDWLLTAEGQGIVRETGYVPVLSAKNAHDSNKPSGGDVQ